MEPKGLGQDLQEFGDFVASITNLLGSVLADNKVSLSDLSFENIRKAADVYSSGRLALEGRETITWEQLDEIEEQEAFTAYVISKISLPPNIALTEKKIKQMISGAIQFVGGFIIKE